MRIGGRNRGSGGFTIVELLIVVVVIAILAAITIVSFNGITERSKQSALQADISNAAKRLETLKLQAAGEVYPASLGAAGITASTGNTLSYHYSSTDNSYCLQGTNGQLLYSANSHTQNLGTGGCGEDGLVSAWYFNGNANNAIAGAPNGDVSGPTLAQGQNNSADGSYLFPGGSAYISFGNQPVFNQTELTMSAWVRPTIAPNREFAVMAKELKYKFRLNSPTTMQVLASQTSVWTHTVSCIYAPSFVANTWYHVAYTLSSNEARIKLYVNGEQICDREGPVVTGFNTNPLMVGTHNTAGSEGFPGRIDDARFYGRALKAAEIRGIYELGAR